MTLEDIDKKENFSLDDINEDLDDLWGQIRKGKIDRQTRRENYVVESIKGHAEISGIPSSTVSEYINLIKDFYSPDKIKPRRYMDDNLKNKLGLGKLSYRLDYYKGIILFHVKKFCPNEFENIANLILSNEDFSSLLALDDCFQDDFFTSFFVRLWALGNLETEYSPVKDVINFIEKNGDISYQCLKFCTPCKGSYLEKYLVKNSKSVPIDADAIKEEGNLITVIHFFEIFINEPESINLLQYLMGNPQKLRNLGGKEIKEIDLSLDSGTSFAFRGIIEMVKSRPDLDFPNMGKGKKTWEQQRGKIIKEYENMLRNYISKDFSDGKNVSYEENHKKTFDRIFFTRPYLDEILDSSSTSRDWLKKFTGNEIIDHSSELNLASNRNNSLYRPPIEGAGIEEEYQKLSNSEQLLFNIGLKKIIKGGYVYKVEFGNVFREKVKKDYVSTSRNFEREIFINNRREKEDMFSDIEFYIKEHPREKILVCIEEHGGEDGSSSNGRSREDRIKLANLSPNLKVWSIRCHFGKALENANIYNYTSPISGFSNHSATRLAVTAVINEGLKKGLGFNELEIYTRLNYGGSVTPLTEDMTYTNKKTKKIETGKVGLAENNIESNNNELNPNDIIHDA